MLYVIRYFCCVLMKISMTGKAKIKTHGHVRSRFFYASLHAERMLLKQSNVVAMLYNEICPEGQRYERVQE